MSDLPAGASLHVSELLTLQVLVQVAAAEALALRDLDSTPPIGDALLSYRMAGELFIVGRDAIRAAMPASSEDLVRIAGRAMCDRYRAAVLEAAGEDGTAASA